MHQFGRQAVRGGMARDRGIERGVARRGGARNRAGQPCCLNVCCVNGESAASVRAKDCGIE